LRATIVKQGTKKLWAWVKNQIELEEAKETTTNVGKLLIEGGFANSSTITSIIDNHKNLLYDELWFFLRAKDI